MSHKFPGIFLIGFVAAVLSVQAEMAPSKFNPAEQWVVTQVNAGEIADLSEKFSDETARKLSAHFLEDLLTGTLADVKLHRHGVRIIGAIIEEPVDLENAQIPCEVWLNSFRFVSRAIFTNSSFAQTVSIEHSAFSTDANFTGMKVGSDAVFQNTVFEGPVRFVAANIVGEFVAREAQFRSKEQRANFEGMKVGSDVFFRKAVFEGSANFIAVDVVSEFHMEGAQFRNPEGFITFEVMKVGSAAFFTNAVFEGPVSFSSANITGIFVADEAQFRNKEFGATFNAMKVGSHASLNKTVFEGPVDFDYAEFAWLDLSNSFSSKVAAQIRIQGMNYKYIRAASSERESHEALLKLVSQTAYTADVYRNLEEFFLRQGYRQDADRAFIAGKRRERQDLHGSRWLGSWLLDLLAGYGRYPSQAAYFCSFFVLLGCVLFSPRKMEPQRKEDSERIYNRFWYSFGLFLPFVDLRADKIWKPKNSCRFLRNYGRVHILLGWILIPIALAALTGLIK